MSDTRDLLRLAGVLAGIPLMPLDDMLDDYYRAKRKPSGKNRAKTKAARKANKRRRQK